MCYSSLDNGCDFKFDRKFSAILESHNDRRPRDLGSMNFGNQAGGNMGPGVNNFGPSDGLRNPERPQLESIYRGKFLWGKQILIK